MDIRRRLQAQIIVKLQPGKIVVVYGPRRVGKTHLLTKISRDLSGGDKIKFLNGETRLVQDNLASREPEKIKQYLAGATLVIIDEAQKIPQVGDHLKLLVDTMPELKVIASGSASFVLSQSVGEPLTGRQKTLTLYPISIQELADTFGIDGYQGMFEKHLILGGYPEVFVYQSRQEQEEYLRSLVDSYLLRDILEMEDIKSPKKIRDLLTLLAFQIGQEVSLTELGSNLDLHKDTVYRYLDLLEKAFVLVNIRGFSRNLRKEVTKNSRYYFYDNGVRNAVINNFNPPNLRGDIGMLWENYLVMERLKKQAYAGIFSNNYFWRTYDQKEIDWVEEREGKLFGYEIKWGKAAGRRAPRDWVETYDNAGFQSINQENYLPFVLEE